MLADPVNSESGFKACVKFVGLLDLDTITNQRAVEEAQAPGQLGGLTHH
jgi:hypothetical protein